MQAQTPPIFLKETIMQTGPTSPLEFAQKVLSQEILKVIIHSPSYNPRSWKILDRWAYNSPQKLRQLEAQGEIILLSRLLEQQYLETEVLDQAEEMADGMAEHEILEMHHVQTELL
jgi:hypothetical protein